MPSLSQRSYEKELLDSDRLPFEDIRVNMQELDVINSKLGGHRVTLKGMRSFGSSKSPLHVMEIGCGGGDNLRAIRRSLEGDKSVQFTGVDINGECIAYARSLPLNDGIAFTVSDYRELQLTKPPDVIFSSLFCHHFADADIIEMLRWMKANSRLGFFINDLHRHQLAYHSIRILTRIFSKSYLVKNDAPLSVRRGFKKHDWVRLFAAAGITNYICSWNWAFRWLIISKHE